MFFHCIFLTFWSNSSHRSLQAITEPIQSLSLSLTTILIRHQHDQHLALLATSGNFSTKHNNITSHATSTHHKPSASLFHHSISHTNPHTHQPHNPPQTTLPTIIRQKVQKTNLILSNRIIGIALIPHCSTTNLHPPRITNNLPTKPLPAGTQWVCETAYKPGACDVHQHRRRHAKQ